MLRLPYRSLIRFNNSPALPISEIIDKVLGEDKKNAITCRYADLLEPELHKIEEEMKQWKQQDEDVLSYALFPQVATEFFKYREAQQTKVDATVADTKNGAYPV